MSRWKFRARVVMIWDVQVVLKAGERSKMVENGGRAW